ncbi:ATP-binding protein [Bradyrhizobium cosmicum]|uniref:ATP-binding protein n=1 Tax=Bradyrhizobium cosmicum TaxID=1404864 RepID=UPI0039658548
MFEALALARGDGRSGRTLKTLGRVQLLILDDWGCRFSIRPARATFSRSSMIATVAPRPSSPARSPSNTGNDITLGDAIPDRLVHNAHRLQLTGERMRKKNVRNQTLDAASNP